MQYKQKPLTQAQQRAHRIALKGLRSDNASYVTRKVTRGIGNVEHFVPRRDQSCETKSLNFMVTGKRWNGEAMA
jgi:hypothetical protein